MKGPEVLDKPVGDVDILVLLDRRKGILGPQLIKERAVVQYIVLGIAQPCRWVIPATLELAPALAKRWCQLWGSRMLVPQEPLLTFVCAIACGGLR